MRLQRRLAILAACLMLTAPAIVAQKKTASGTGVSARVAGVSAARLQRDVEAMAAFGTRHTLSAAARPGRGVAAAREWVRGEFEKISRECGGCLEVKEDRFTAEKAARIPQPTEIVNVYAVLRGSDPAQSARTLLIGGHLDSRASDVMQPEADSPGANDDASGVAATIEAARVLSKLKPPATLVFIAFTGEEQGLNGSRHMAELAKKEGWKIEAFLNNDTVGGDKSQGQDPGVVRVFSEGIPASAVEQAKAIRGLGAENDSPSRQIARYLAEVARENPGIGLKVTMIWRSDRYLRGGDHTPFNEAGFPAVRLVEWRENYDHQHQDVRTEAGKQMGDLPQFVDYTYLAKVTRLNAGALLSMALAPAPPANVKLLTTDLTNDSTLTWTAVPGVSYEVVWRETSAPDWQQSRRVGQVGTATLPVSKDNVIFAVRSVGPQGHKSLPVTPAPAR